MKTKILTIAFSCVLSVLFAQNYQFNYQAVIRDSSKWGGTVPVKFIIKQSNNPVYTQSYSSVSVSQYGVINLTVGPNGDGSNDKLSNLNWGSVSYDLNVMIDNVDAGTKALVGVPYAFHAAKSDTSAFALSGGDKPGCPTGSVRVNDEYCIDVSEKSSADWWLAVKNCRNSNGHLCSVSEWYAAVDKSLNGGLPVSLVDVADDNEWTSTGAGTSDNTMISIGNVNSGTSEFTVSGLFNGVVLNPKPYRCCYNRVQ